jgi:uncharacterized protein (DUF2252 family)
MVDIIAKRIKSFNEGRLPKLLDIKYKAMREDRYRFFRATPHLFYQDIPSNSFLHNSPNVWLCGDLHLENLGSYKGDNRVAYFDVNDFDECILGPCLFDVCRILTSIYMATSNLDINITKAHQLCQSFVNTYFDKLEEGYIRVLEKETTHGVIKSFLETITERTRKDLIKKRTIKKKGRVQLLIDEIHTLKISDKEKETVATHLRQWAKNKRNPGFYKVLDVAFRIAGTSSLGLERYVVLVERRGGLDGHFLIDIKETLPSCAKYAVKTKQPKWPSEADRQVEVQKRMLAAPPALLSSLYIGKKNFILKELQPAADRIDYTRFHGNEKKLKDVIENMASICAWGALRSSGRQKSAIADELIHFARTNKYLKKQVMEYAYNYSQTLGKYHKAYCQAYDEGFFKTKQKPRNR